MQPNEALQYLTQLANDYVRSLPPSAAMPVQQVAQEAINTVAALVNPPALGGPVPPGEGGAEDTRNVLAMKGAPETKTPGR